MSAVRRVARGFCRASAPGALAVLAAVVGSVLVWQASQDALHANPANGPDFRSPGAVVLSGDDAGSTMFTAHGLKPGDTGSTCITVVYTGSRAAAIRLYGATRGALAEHLNLVVEQGTQGTTRPSRTCSGFTMHNILYTGTLGEFSSAATDYASGVRGFVTSGPAQSTTYRFTYELRDNNSAQGTSASATFTWQAHGRFNQQRMTSGPTSGP